MLCTIFENPEGRKEIVYDKVPGGIVYEVAEEKIKQVQEVETRRVQELINFICLTSRRVGNII